MKEKKKIKEYDTSAAELVRFAREYHTRGKNKKKLLEKPENK